MICWAIWLDSALVSWFPLGSHRLASTAGAGWFWYSKQIPAFWWVIRVSVSAGILMLGTWLRSMEYPWLDSVRLISLRRSSSSDSPLSVARHRLSASVVASGSSVGFGRGWLLPKLSVTEGMALWLLPAGRMRTITLLISVWFVFTG